MWTKSMLVGLTLASFSSTATGSTGALSTVLTSLADSPQCLLIHIDLPSRDSGLGGGRQAGVVYSSEGLLTMASAPGAARALVLFLRSAGAWCSATVLHGSNPRSLFAIARLSKAIRRNFFVVAGRKEGAPANKELLAVERPLVWIKQESLDLAKIFVNCSTVKKDISPNLRLASVWISGQQNRHLAIQCDNPMRGQTLEFAYNPGFPSILTPHRTGGRPLAGCMVRAAQLVAEKYDFRVEFRQTGEPVFHQSNKTFTGTFGRVIAGEAFAANGGVALIVNLVLDMATSLFLAEEIYASRTPLPVDAYWNILAPFSPGVWAMTWLSLLVLGMAFGAFHSVYTDAETYGCESTQLVLPEASKANFVLFSMTKITEPEPLPWFRAWSAGKFLVFIWSGLGLFLIMFYTSNLRAHLISNDHETPIDTLEDVLENGKRIWMYESANRHRTAYLEAAGQTNTIRYKVAQMAEGLGGVYSLSEHRGLHPDAPKEVSENRAVFLLYKEALPYVYLIDRERFARDKLHTPRDNAGTLYAGLVFQKFSPITELANEVIQRALDFGLVDRYMTEYLPSSQVAASSPSSAAQSLEPLELYSLYAPYLFLLGGITVGCAVFLAEVSGRKEKSTDMEMAEVTVREGWVRQLTVARSSS